MLFPYSFLLFLAAFVLLENCVSIQRKLILKIYTQLRINFRCSISVKMLVAIFFSFYPKFWNKLCSRFSFKYFLINMFYSHYTQLTIWRSWEENNKFSFHSVYIFHYFFSCSECKFNLTSREKWWLRWFSSKMFTLKQIFSLAAVDGNQIVARKHSLGASEDRILCCVVRVILWRDLEHSWDWGSVRIDNVTNKFSVVLVDQNDIDVIAFQETLEAILKFADWSI